MDRREQALYHQIHPAKLATDIGTTVPSLWLFWGGYLFAGMFITIVPSVVASALVIRYGDLQHLKDSAAGAYLRRHMGPTVQAARLAGLLILILGAWYHLLWVLPIGFLVIVVAWFHGFLLRGREQSVP